MILAQFKAEVSVKSHALVTFDNMNMYNVELF